MRFILAILFIVAFTSTQVFAVGGLWSNKNHTDRIGRSDRIYQYGYFDYLIGDGVNAYEYGFQKVQTAKTASTSVLVADCGKIFTNYGAPAGVVFDLPAWAAGLNYTFVQASGGSLYVRTPAGAKFLGGTAGYSVVSNTVGNTITVVAALDSTWIIQGYSGTWTAVSY
jgi:hypothetical protein